MNDDLISRQEAIDALWKALYKYEDKMEKQFIESDDLDVEEWIPHRIFVQNMSDIDRKAILDLPSEEPERKTGEWIWNPNGMDWNIGAWCCSECGSKAETWWATDETFNPMRCSGGKFCGNCGAKMEGDSE